MRKINTLQSLRFLAFLSIFIIHVGHYNIINYPLSPAWGVSFFIILSGFLSGYKCSDYNRRYSFNDIKNFILRKIKKFYPLHLVTLIISIPMSAFFVHLTNKDFPNFIIWFKNFMINALLLQGYFDKEYFSFNGVSWFLCLMVFLTIVTLPLIILISKIIKTRNGIIKLLFCMLAIILIDYIYVIYVKNHSLPMEYWLYVFPLSRLPEYICGLITGFIIKNKEDVVSIKNYTISIIFSVFEILSILGVLFVTKHFSINEWLWRGFAWVIPNIILIAIFSFEKGLVSKLLNNKLLVWLGNISFEAFLIHQLVIRYFSLLIDSNPPTRLPRLTSEVYILVLTIIISNFVNLSTKNNALIKKNKEKSLVS